MANKKISELQTRTPSLTDLILVGDPSNGFSYKCTVSALATIIETDIADGYVTLGTTQTISGAKTFSNNLTLTSVANASTDPDKFLVLNGSNVVNYRTGSEVLSDIGGQGTITLTTTGTSGAATFAANTLNIPQYQGVITLTTTGTSGAATLVGNTLNIPNYAPDLSGYVPTSRTITINGTTQDLTANRTYNVGTVTSVAASGGTGISISGSPITSSGTITITNTAPDQIVALTAGTGISISGTYPNFTITNSSPSLGGTVTSVALSAPTGFAVTGSPITSSGTLALAFASGYSLPTTASQTNWDSAYNNMIVSAAVTGTTTKTLTLTQQDAGTITASWTDDNTDAVTSVFGRTGAVVAVSGDYNTSQVTESTNLYFTDARARGALSAGTGISYSTTTGVIASTITQYTDAMARAAISLTTTGSSGSATYSNTTGVLNIPTYTLAGLGGISLSSLSAFVPLIYNNTTGQFSITQSNSTNDGYLSATDWNTFNNKQATITLTTTGTSGAATFTSNTLNIPQYQGALTLTTTGTSGAATLVGNTLNIPQYSGGGGTVSGTTNYIAKFTSSTAVGDSLLFDDGTNVGIGTTTPASKLNVFNGNITISGGYGIAWATDQTRIMTPEDGVSGALIRYAGGGMVRFLNGSTEHMRLNPNGILFVGKGETDATPSTGIVSGTGGFGPNIAGAELRIRGGASTGNAAGGPITFYTSAAGSSGTGINAATERMRLSAGNFLINQTTSLTGVTNSVELTGAGNTDATQQASYSVFANHGTFAANTGYFVFNKSRGTTAGSVTAVASGDRLGMIRWNGADGTAQIRAAEIYSEVDGTPATNDMPGRIVFATTLDGASSPTERMRITNSGTIGIGTATIGSTLQVNGNAAIGYSASTAAPTNGLAVAGSIGIGTTTINAALQVTGASGTGFFAAQRLDNTTNNAYQTWSFGGSTAGGVAGFVNANILEAVPFSTGNFVISAFSNNMVFMTNNRNERMRITSGGSIGIGTTTIGSTLQVNGNAAIGYSASTAAPTNGLLVAGTSRFAYKTTTSTESSLVIGDDIAASTNTGRSKVTIGNTSAVSELLVGQSSTNALLFNWTYNATAANAYGVLETYGGNNNIVLQSSGGNIGITTATIGSKLQINGNLAIGYSASTAAPTNGLAVSGNVGIGTNSPSGRLDLSSSSDNYLNILTSGAASAAVLNMFNSVSGGDGAAIGYNIALRFGTVTGVNAAGFTERMRITSGGQLTLATGANVSAIAQTGYSLTGSNASSLLDLAGTWNTTGNPAAIKLNITNTASGASAYLMDLQVGGTTQFRVTKAGAIRTTAPTGGTANDWKLGTRVAATVVLDTTQYAEVEIGGTLYKLAMVN